MGDSLESFRCQPSFHIFSLVTNGTGLCLLHRFKGKASSCQVNIQIREMLNFLEEMKSSSDVSV